MAGRTHGAERCGAFAALQRRHRRQSGAGRQRGGRRPTAGWSPCRRRSTHRPRRRGRRGGRGTTPGARARGRPVSPAAARAGRRRRRDRAGGPRWRPPSRRDGRSGWWAPVRCSRNSGWVANRTVTSIHARATVELAPVPWPSGDPSDDSDTYAGLRSLVVRPATDGSGARPRPPARRVDPSRRRRAAALARAGSLLTTRRRPRWSAPRPSTPRAAARFEAAGFEVADRLVLLRADLDDPRVRAAIDRAATGRLGRCAGTTSAPPPAIDRAAFGAGWGHDAAELAEICRATPVHAARYRLASPRRHGLPGRARAGRLRHRRGVVRTRLPPAPCRRSERPTPWPRAGVDHRRLALDGRRRLPDCLVNTSVDNSAALALYDVDRLHADGRAAHRPPLRRPLAAMSAVVPSTGLARQRHAADDLDDHLAQLAMGRSSTGIDGGRRHRRRSRGRRPRRLDARRFAARRASGTSELDAIESGDVDDSGGRPASPRSTPRSTPCCRRSSRPSRSRSR